MIYITEPRMYDEDEIDVYFSGLGLPYRAAVDVTDMWQGADEAQYVVCARARLSAEVFDRMPALRGVVKWGRGLERIDVAAAAQRGVTVAYTPFAVQGVAEAALLFMLALSKQMPAHMLGAKTGVPADALPTGHDLAGKVLGIVGFGAVGRTLARLARSLGMDILITTRSTSLAKETVARNLGAELVNLSTLLHRAHYISLHASAEPNSPPILGAREFMLMQEGAYLINTARGSLIDEGALITALREGRLGGAALDVVRDEPIAPDNPLVRLDLPNVIVTPHSLGVTRETRRHIKEGIRAALIAMLTGGVPQYVAR